MDFIGLKAEDWRLLASAFDAVEATFQLTGAVNIEAALLAEETQKSGVDLASFGARWGDIGAVDADALASRAELDGAGVLNSARFIRC